MTTERPEQLVKLEIDAEQWQRDIRTFAETTNQAIHAIVSQLSNSCVAGGRSQIEKSNGLPHYESDPPHESLSHASTTAARMGDGDRLSQLKSQLAQRIFRSR